MKKIYLLLVLLVQLFMVENVQAQCTHTIQLTDTWGDGWNGGRVAVSVNGVAVLTNLGSTFTSGAGPISFNFTATAGQTIRVYRTAAGSYSYEMRIRVINNVGTTVINTIEPITGTATSGGRVGTAVCAAASYNPCTTIPTISGCGTSATASMTGTGAGWNITSCGWNTPGQERLFQFTAPTTGTYTLNVSAITGGYVDFFWKPASGGCNATGWNCIDDIYLTGTYAAVTPMTFTAGTTYYILLDPEVTTATSATFNMVCPAAGPANDLVCSAASITCGGTVSGTTIGAGNAGTGENQTCGTGQTMPGVWYVVAGNGQTMTASLCGTVWDSKISVFSGTNCSALTCIGGNDDSGPACGTTSASYSWPSVVGQNYYILVHGYIANSAFSINLSCVAPCSPPSNDLCANAPILNLGANNNQTHLGTGACSTPNLGTYKDVFVAFTVPCGGMNVTIDFCGSTPVHNNAYLNIFPNCSFATFTGATTWDFTSCVGGNIKLYWNNVPAGTYYYPILIDPTWETNYVLNISGTPLYTNATAPTSISGTTTVCSGQSTTLTLQGGSAGTNGVAQWFAGSCGSAVIGTGNSITVSPTVNTTYFVRYAGSCNTTACASASVTITPATVAPTFTGGATTICANGTDTYSATTTQGTVSYSIIGGTGASINATSGVLSSAGTANFTVRATSTNGVCSSLTTDRAVTVNPAPTLLSLTGSAVCSGLGTITSSTSQSGGNYQLYNSANTAVGSVLAGTGSGLAWSSIAAGTGYYVIGTDATTSCNSAASSPVSVTINSAPTVTANVSSTPVCLGTTVTLSGGGATTFSWDNGAINGAVFAPAATTTYTVIGTDANGCTNTASVLVTVNTPAVTTSVVAGTVVWRGASSNDFGTPSNWYAFDGTSYAVSASAPSSATSVIIPVNQGCVSQQPSTLANSGSVKNITIEVGATLTMQNGTLVVVGNWENNGTFDAGTGTVQFGGTINTTIGGSASNNFNNVEMNKSGEALLISPATIAGSLTLTNGNLNIEGYTLDMGSQVINGGSASSYVKTIGSGELKRDVSSSPVVFPVGKSSYNPATLTNTGTADNFSVRVYDYVSTTGVEGGAQTTGQVVNRTWMVSEALTGGSDVTLKMQWNTGEELNGFVYNPGFMNVNHHNGSLWEELGVLNESNSPFYVEQSGISSFSPFTIGITGSPLPIELISFQANCAGNKQVEVTWSTASEHNTSHFVVEKSRDGLNWITLNTLGAAGNSTTVIEYALTDNNEVSGTTYYRLTQFDNDGVSETFNIASVNCGEQAVTSNLVTYPNPSNGSFYVDFYTQDLTGPSSISVFDSRGVIIYRQDVLVEKGSNVFHIEKMEAAPGMYYIQVSNGTTTSYIVKHSLR